MNILVVVHYHYQGINVPTALFVHNQMKAFAQAGHQVRALVPIAWGKRGEDGRRFGPALSRMDVDSIEHLFLRHWSFSNYGRNGLNTRCAMAALRRHIDRILEDFRPDVIHAHKLGGNTEVAALLREQAGCPLVFTSHGETQCEEPWKSDIKQAKPFADKADRVVCVSSATRATMEAARVSAPLQVICNGFAIGSLLSVGEKRPGSILQAGYLIPRKHADVTIEAFRLLHGCHPETSLAIIGKGPEREALEEQCARIGLTEAVRFTGEVPNRELLVEMGKTQFFVMPSIQEGFGIVYLEAMASGCITIGTEGEGIADLIVSGENGFLVPPDDPDTIVQVIEWCLEHPEEAAAIAERGRRDALDLTWEKNAEQYIRLFESLTERK